MIKKINVVVVDDVKSMYGLQIFDKLYAYSQSLNKNYKSSFDVIFSDKIKPEYINILFSYMPDYIDNINEYDVVIFDNSDEPIGIVNTDFMLNKLHLPHVFVQSGSFFHAEKNFFHNKLITSIGDAENFLYYMTRSFYPQYYENNNQTRSKSVCFINGRNDAHRNFFYELLSTYTDIDCMNYISNGIIHETNDSLLESPKDTEFREYVNSKFSISRNVKTSYYSNSVKCGIDNKFEEIPPGYFVMDEYYQYHIVAYPETTWINNEIIITEKSFKCFYSKCLPFPVGGQNLNKLFNAFGFQTAWNILPHDLQKFDSEEDHMKRYLMMTEAISWLQNNIFDIENFNDIVSQNKEVFLTNKFSKIGVEKLYEILNKK